MYITNQGTFYPSFLLNALVVSANQIASLALAAMLNFNTIILNSD
jgi:hypothetical protein